MYDFDRSHANLGARRGQMQQHRLRRGDRQFRLGGLWFHRRVRD